MGAQATGASRSWMPVTRAVPAVSAVKPFPPAVRNAFAVTRTRLSGVKVIPWKRKS